MSRVSCIGLGLLGFALLHHAPGPLAFVGPRAHFSVVGPGRPGCRFGPCSVVRRSGKVEISFSHVHLYVDTFRSLEEYKALEAKLNAFTTKRRTLDSCDLTAGRKAWLGLALDHGDPVAGASDPAQWVAAGQDLPQQLLVGLGWRVTGFCRNPGTQTLVVTSPDPQGVRFVFTAHEEHGIQQLASAKGLHPAKPNEGGFDHFDARHLARFSRCRGGREGIAVLGFAVPAGTVEKIRANYERLHPELLVPGSPMSYAGTLVLEVFAYYVGAKGTSAVDHGTVLRFVETSSQDPGHWVLPGVERIGASFCRTSIPAYSDHWVSNVVSRTGFLDTLYDTLGFNVKVDFNAGVVAAGEAQIESTVTGNDPGLLMSDHDTALRNQRQVYLPINNALSEVGHVHLYLQEIGQGVQHIASRVADLPALVQHANDIRAVTGAGLAFLSIPRFYYGTLTAKQLSKDAEIGDVLAQRCVAALEEAGILDGSGIVDLDATRERVQAALPKSTPERVIDHVLRARYRNVYMLAGDTFNEETYLTIVRNNILIDVQGEDLLLQIFTRNVLQRSNGEEAPFLEFIQRVCSENPDPNTEKSLRIRPGCGGFGIRNFLTLFLSIELGKATTARVEAEAAGDAEAAAYYSRVVGLFASQLDESNPVLTAISDAMTAEGEALERGDITAAKHHEAEKVAKQAALQSLSSKYEKLMCELRKRRSLLGA